MNREQFFKSLSGKTVTFCGIGRSHMPLIKLFQEQGAVVSARDKRSFQELSGGQRQRVLLARALVAAQSILLVDEPVAGLDIHSASELYALIDSLNREGMTIMMVTHDIHPALNSASHILHLGHDCFFGPKADYFSSRIGQRYLEEAGHHD